MIDPIRIWYMRDNRTFRSLPLDVDEAMAVMRSERDNRYASGMLCGRPHSAVPEPVHARSAAEWPAFELAAREWLTAAVDRSKPPNTKETP